MKFRYGITLCAIALSLSPAAAGARSPARPQPNLLTAAELAKGWRLLFDGSTLQGWRNYRSKAILPGWRVEGNCLTLDGYGGDIITNETFENFELSYEWRISPGGNSGVFYNVVEGSNPKIWQTGPEMQVLDNDLSPDARNPTHQAGAAYDLFAPRVRAVLPVGRFNKARIIVNRGHVQHWLNGKLVVEYDLWSPAWRAAVAASKFADLPGYGLARSGHIALQDHGDRVWFRNIKVRRL